MTEGKKTNKKPKTVTGLPENTEAALCYIFGWVSGLILYLLSDNKKIRFHALQSLVVFGAISIFMAIPGIGWRVAPLLGLVSFIFWLVLIVKAYQGEDYVVPVLGEWAKKEYQSDFLFG